MGRDLIAAVKATSVKKTFDELHKPETTFMEAFLIIKRNTYFSNEAEEKILKMMISSAIRLSGVNAGDSPLLHEQDRL